MNTEGITISRQRLVAIFWLVAASCLCLGILAARMLYMHNLDHRAMAWNLFLAWVPLVCALAAERLRGRAMLLACGAAWLVFLPNAPYLLTDLVHLTDHGSYWFWYDLIMLLSFGLTGLLLGYVSLYAMQKLVAGRFGNAAGWVFAVATLGLCSFGVYLGRFERFNSWDVVFNPFDLLLTIYSRVRHPFDHPWTYVLSFMLAALLVAIYAGLHSFARFMREPIPPMMEMTRPGLRGKRG
jgi:uncharacterized membrane protein